MYCLEQQNAMPASAEEVSEALEEGVLLNCGWGPKAVSYTHLPLGLEEL